MRTVHVDIIVNLTVPLKPGDDVNLVVDELNFCFFDTGNGGNIEDTEMRSKEILSQTKTKAVVKLIIHAVLKLDDETVNLSKWFKKEMEYTFKNGNDDLQDAKIVDYDITDSH